jgi:hypothetical protein
VFGAGSVTPASSILEPKMIGSIFCRMLFSISHKHTPAAFDAANQKVDLIIGDVSKSNVTKQ